ncbi:MAG TPA: Hsp20/alpha crystallin family protein [Pyrinomonadaceae bacterium]|jgi:HSP20 family protein
MAKSIERYFRLLPKTSFMRAGGRQWYPSADVYQTRDGWIVKVELAGVAVDEVEVRVEGDMLYISGNRQDGFCSETLSCYQLEITYSRFEKTIRFPCPIESAQLQRSYRDGLLILRLRSPENCDEGQGA